MGDRKVLSTTQMAPISRARRDHAAMSVILSSGLLGVSSQISRGRSARARARAPGALKSTNRTL